VLARGRANCNNDGDSARLVKALFVSLLCAAAAANPLAQTNAVGPVPDALRRELKLDGFYQKHSAVAGYPIVGSTNVSDHALREAAWILEHLLAGREDILRTMTAQQSRLVVMAWNEFMTDLPEQRDMEPRVFWDRRARGLGGTPVSCAEENLLGTAQDSFSICIGDQPELDFGGKRNPDGQGFAAFGKLVKGVDVVRKIHASSAEGQQLSPPVLIQRAIRLN
jgi:hypothetical protein